MRDFRWCPQHLNHRHCLCRYPSCANYATTYSYSKNAKCCRDHHKIWETRIYYYTARRRSPLHVNASRISFIRKKAIGHCTNCNCTRQTLRKKRNLWTIGRIYPPIELKAIGHSRIATECGKLFAKNEFMHYSVEFIRPIDRNLTFGFH